MIGFNGGLIGGFRDTTNGTASVPGVWTANEQVVAQRRWQWARLADPFFSNVSLLLPGDGANGSTSIIDRSPSSKTLTLFGNTQISTAQSKFGGSSIRFDGSGDVLRASSGGALGSGNFTVETWVYPVSRVSLFPAIFTNYITYGAGIIGLFVEHASSLGKYSVSCNGSDNVIVSSVNVVYNAWAYVALVRNGSSLTLYVDGQNVGSVNIGSITLNGAGNPVFVGGGGDDPALGGPSSSSINAFFDDFRLSTVARYTANFTPPTEPHPLS